MMEGTGDSAQIQSNQDTQAQKAKSSSATSRVLRSSGYLLLKIGAIVAIALLLFSFVFGLFYNVDPSMVPAVKDGDLVMFYRLDKTYKAGDSIVLDYKGQNEVRRVVATEGNVVDITKNGLMVNGALQQEPEIYSPTKRYTTGVDFPLTVKKGQVFVLGDNRKNATDSRVYGAVDIKNTLGKVMGLLRRRAI